MIDVVYEYLQLNLLPRAARRSRTPAEEERYSKLHSLLTAPSNDVGERRWARVGLVRAIEVVVRGEARRAMLVDCSAGGFRIDAEGKLDVGDEIEVRIREKSRPTFAAQGGVVRFVEARAVDLGSTAVQTPSPDVAFDRTEVGVEAVPDDYITYRFPCRVVWSNAKQHGLELTGIPRC